MLLVFSSCEKAPGETDPLIRREKEKIVKEFKVFDSTVSTDLTLKVKLTVSSSGNTSKGEGETRIVTKVDGDDVEFYSRGVAIVDGKESGAVEEIYFKDGKYYYIARLEDGRKDAFYDKATYEEVIEDKGGTPDETATTMFPLTYDEMCESKVKRKDGTLMVEYKSDDDDFCERVQTIMENMTGSKFSHECFSPYFSAVFNEDNSIKELKYAISYNYEHHYGNNYSVTVGNRYEITIIPNQYKGEVTVPVPDDLDSCIFDEYLIHD